MGSGRSNEELTWSSKAPRERQRRMKMHRKRLMALGVPEAVVGKLNAKELRAMLTRPAKIKQRWTPRMEAAKV
ncbi:MAG: hypothetical protein HY343_02625 [Lentisphaerae bacterium]|nr:hypothetical protein [Lentisphaerota bacterium]